MDLRLRPYHPTDLEQVVELFTETVHSVNKSDYTEGQLAAWAPDEPDLERWASRIAASDCILAVHRSNDKILGFASLVDYHYLDFLYVRANVLRSGVASTLLKEIEAMASRSGAESLSANSSITAKPFFEKMGYECTGEQEVKRGDERLLSFRMRKDLE